MPHTPIETSQPQQRSEGRRSVWLSRIALALYGRFTHERIRVPLRRLLLRVENEFYSLTLREIFRRFHGVDVGMYTFGPLNAPPDNFRPEITIGRYCSIFPSTRRFNMNHPMNIKSTHPFFYDTQTGFVDSDLVASTKLTIGNDVWIGHNVIIHATVETIGDGAVIAAGAVVSTNVPPYAVVAGYPARVVRYRFSPETIQKLLAEKWWLKSIDELKGEMADFRKPIETDGPVR
jgi:virginiamycin A acetyltransferase